MKKYINVFFIVLLILSLVGCNNSVKPHDVRQEVWDEAIRLYTIIDEKAKNGELLDYNDTERILMFESKYSKRRNKDATDAEDEIVNMILTLAKYKIEMDKSVIEGTTNATPYFRDAYTQYVKVVEKKFNVKP